MIYKAEFATTLYLDPPGYRWNRTEQEPNGTRLFTSLSLPKDLRRFHPRTGPAKKCNMHLYTIILREFNPDLRQWDLVSYESF